MSKKKLELYELIRTTPLADSDYLWSEDIPYLYENNGLGKITIRIHGGGLLTYSEFVAERRIDWRRTVKLRVTAPLPVYQHNGAGAVP